MPELAGTRTERNLLAAFAGESQARNRYTFFAKVARKEGYPLIQQVFLETADNERSHAKRFFRFLEGGEVEITATFPARVIGTTLENLAAVARDEREEWSALYPRFAREAQEEGFPEVAAVFSVIAGIERVHEARFRALAERLEAGTLWKRVEVTRWKCAVCGLIHEGTEPPDTCPGCLHGRHWFVEEPGDW